MAASGLGPPSVHAGSTGGREMGQMFHLHRCYNILWSQTHHDILLDCVQKASPIIRTTNLHPWIWKMGWMFAAEFEVYLYVSVDMPRGLFAIIHWFHCGVRQTSNVSTRKHPGLAGLHGVCVHLWSTPAVQLQRSHGLSHYTQTKIWISLCVKTCHRPINVLHSPSQPLQIWTA